MSLCVTGQACTPNLWLELAPLVPILIAFAIAWWWLRRLIRLQEWRGQK